MTSLAFGGYVPPKTATIERSPRSGPTPRSEVEFGTLTLTKYVDELAQVYRKIIFDPVPQVAP
jgi:hypothetical protein